MKIITNKMEKGIATGRRVTNLGAKSQVKKYSAARQKTVHNKGKPSPREGPEGGLLASQCRGGNSDL